MTFLTINTKTAIRNSLGGTQGAMERVPHRLSPRRGSLPREGHRVLSEITLSTLVKLMSRKYRRGWGPNPDFFTKQGSPRTRSLCPWQAAAGGRGSLLWVTQARQLPNSPPERRLLGCGGNSGTLNLKPAFSKQPTLHESGDFTCPSGQRSVCSTVSSDEGLGGRPPRTRGGQRREPFRG